MRKSAVCSLCTHVWVKGQRFLFKVSVTVMKYRELEVSDHV